MADLSPAAQAVLDAVEDDCIHPDDKHRIAAAALRAAADQLGHEVLGVRCVDCSHIEIIAAELDGGPQ